MIPMRGSYERRKARLEGAEGILHWEYEGLFFLSNDDDWDGRNCDDKLGYRYSWILNSETFRLVQLLPTVKLQFQ